MTLQALLESPSLLQTIVLAISIFNLTTFLWLACTVWLNGDRRAGIVRLGVVGLGSSAIFFFIHSLLISSPLEPSTTFLSLDFWWRLIWLPAIGVPYIWFAIGLHYAAFINLRWRRRRPILLLLSGAMGLSILVMLISNRATFTYIGVLSLLSERDVFKDLGAGLVSPKLMIPLLYLIYVAFCAIGPWFTTGRILRLLQSLWYILQSRRRQGEKRRRIMQAFWNDSTEEIEMLEEPLLSWHLARPGLLLAALLMVGLTTTLGVLVIQSMIHWFGYGLPAPQPVTELIIPSGSFMPTDLLTSDLLANGAVALIILLLGYSVVRHGVLIERPLARRGFFEQWRGIVIVTTLVALFIASLVALTGSSLGGLLLITCLATGAYALFTWSSYTAHDRYIALLGPFVRSTSQRHWMNTDLQKAEQDLEHLFFHLCHNVLAVKCAYLSVVAGAMRRNFHYRWPLELTPTPEWHKLQKISSGEQRIVRAQPKPATNIGPAHRIQVFTQDMPMIIWILPIYNERGLAATLYIGPREDGGTLTEEDMNLAQACGQRILDMLGDHEAMQAVAGLLRRRVIDVKLLGAQQRRVLHDEILPQMHLALLQLEMLRSLPDVERSNQDTNLLAENLAARKHSVDEAISILSNTHRRLAAMMRATAPGAPHRLERDGLINAIQTMLEQDFQNAFDEINWQVSEETATRIDEVISPAIAELIFAAVQEALRNAARHARGSDIHRHLQLTLKATWKSQDGHFELVVMDNGVGLTSADSSTSGTGGGLLTHSALLAIAGGSLTISSAQGDGVTVRITLPTDML